MNISIFTERHPRAHVWRLALGCIACLVESSIVPVRFFHSFSIGFKDE